MQQGRLCYVISMYWLYSVHCMYSKAHTILCEIHVKRCNGRELQVLYCTAHLEVLFDASAGEFAVQPRANAALREAGEDLRVHRMRMHSYAAHGLAPAIAENAYNHTVRFVARVVWHWQPGRRVASPVGLLEAHLRKWAPVYVVGEAATAWKKNCTVRILRVEENKEKRC